MRIRSLKGLLAISICVGVVAFSALISQGNIYALTTDENKQTMDRAAVDKPSTTGFQDPLVTPAKMSLLAKQRLLNGIVSAGTRVIAVGIRGHIVYSDDKGKNWIQSKVPVSTDLTALYFSTADKGWAVGHDGVVLHSIDGGVSWVKQLDGIDVCRIMDEYYRTHPLSGDIDSAATERLQGDIQFLVNQGPVNPFLNVWFEDEFNGFIVGAFNLIFHTTDGGNTWEPWLDRTDNLYSLHLYSIRGVGKDIYIAGEQGLVLKLDRQARRFRELSTPYTGTYFGILGTPGGVIAFGMRGNIFQSRDQGVSWKKVETGFKDAVLGGTVTHDSRIILVTQAGNVMVSEDDGEIFTKINRDKGLGIPLHDVTLADGTTLILAGWLGIQLQQVQSIFAVAAPDEKPGFDSP